MILPLSRPFLRLVSTQPELLGEHAQAYAELFASELDSAASSVKRRSLLAGLAICALGVGAVLTGVAVMLWAVTPSPSPQTLWALAVVPLLPFALALACLIAAKRQSREKAFSHLRVQVAADLATFRKTDLP